MISTKFGPGDTVTVTADAEAPAEVILAALADLPNRIAVEGSSVATVEVLGNDYFRIAAEAYGQSREVDVSLDRISGYALSADATGRQFDATFHANSLAVSDTASQLTLTFTPKPKSISARLLLGTLRLARGALASKAEERLQRFLTRVERDYHHAHRKTSDQRPPDRRKRSAG